jgi:hypothetical protein
MHFSFKGISLIVVLGMSILLSDCLYGQDISLAPAPLYRDPYTDGAADPTVFWNHHEQEWWMFYTQRRANDQSADVAFCYGNRIGIASSSDNGKTWVCRGTLDLEFENGRNTFWAPDVVYENGKYHMFLAYIRGARNHWGGQATMAHYTSENVWDWNFEGLLSLSSDRVIDGTLFKTDDGIWNMWYKDGAAGSVTWLAQSENLYNWEWEDSPVIDDQMHEGPIVFQFDGFYWMVTDQWAGMGVYRSDDLKKWDKQNEVILADASNRPDDKPSGAHGDVVVVDNRAYIFYFTHPGRRSHSEATLDEDGTLAFSERRSSIQVAQLEVVDGLLKVKDRDQSFHFFLPDMDR